MASAALEMLLEFTRTGTRSRLWCMVCQVSDLPITGRCQMTLSDRCQVQLPGYAAWIAVWMTLLRSVLKCRAPWLGLSLASRLCWKEISCRHARAIVFVHAGAKYKGGFDCAEDAAAWVESRGVQHPASDSQVQPTAYSQTADPSQPALQIVKDAPLETSTPGPTEPATGAWGL